MNSFIEYAALTLRFLRRMPDTASENQRYLAVEALRGEWIRGYKESRPATLGYVFPVGLNTIGMLCDRLSILTIKYYNVYKDDRKREATWTQIEEIANAALYASPGKSSTNNKITIHRSDVDPQSFPEAYFELQITNLMIWEAQEVLYMDDMTKLSGEALRDYISAFSRLNIRRNALIEATERLYWAER